ncbi:MAG: DUF4912 domain-containing protein [Spirochaetales bacterium]|nr:DUF4912 domain-containing protein [Candidatus Physcosoma equi]
MVQINLESLSTEELKNLAEQEKIDGFEDMDRDDLIQELSDVLESDPNFVPADEKSEGVYVKYVSSFTDYEEISNSVQELPGVEELPEYYQETAIHLLYKNSDWGYAFWSISSMDQEKIDEEKGTPILVVSVTYKDGNKENYDIPISPEDKEWNIGFSYNGMTCNVSLVVVYPNGKRSTLCQSNTLKLASSYWLNHPEEMKENDTLFKVYLSLLSTKTGDIINNTIVKDIMRDYLEGDIE